MPLNNFAQNLPIWQDAKREISLFWTFPTWHVWNYSTGPKFEISLCILLTHLYTEFQFKMSICNGDNETRGPKGHISCTWVQCANFLTDQPGRQILFTHRPESTNLVEDIEILLPVKFHWIPFSGFREEVENVSAKQTQERPSCFSDRPEKHKLGRGLWDLASCHV